MIAPQFQTLLPAHRLNVYRVLLAVGATALFGLTLLIGEQPAEGVNPIDVVIALFAFPTFYLFIVGLRGINSFFEKRYRSSQNQYRRFTEEVPVVIGWSLFLTTVLQAVPVCLVMYGQAVIDFNSPRQWMMFQHLYTFTALVHVLLYLIITAFYTMQRAFQQARTAEQLRKENIQKAFETLKNQVSPHFLFNSLNALSVLIYRDKEEASQFVDELSAVYRYVLDHKDKELVLLEQELTFMRAYIHLLKVRYRETLEISLPEQRSMLRWNLPPLTLQTVVDHALKRQVASRELPLNITIAVDEGKKELHIRYHSQPRDVVDEDAQADFDYLSTRYRYLTDRPMRYDRNDTIFDVCLPLLEID